MQAIKSGAGIDIASCFRSIPDVIRIQARAHGDTIAFVTPSRTWTYAELDRQSNHVAQGLVNHGVGAGDTVACLTKHTAECILLLLAAGKLGARLSPLNWRLSARELDYVVEVARPKVLVADAFLTGTLRDVRMPDVLLHLVTEDDGSERAFCRWAQSFPALDPGAAPAPEDAAVLLFSSGTTGRPKAVDLGHLGILTHCEAWTPIFGFEEGRTVHLNVLPTFHVSGIVNAIWMLSLHARAVFYPQFEPQDWLAAVARHRVTDSFVVPAMLRALIGSPAIHGTDLSSLRSIAYGGSPIDERLLTDAIAAFGCGFAQVFGMTECSGTVTVLTPDDHDPGGPRAHLLRSAGKPAPHIAIRIVEPTTGAECADGAVGEAWIRSRQNMRGYLGNAEATAAAFPEGQDEDGGWLRSGDAGYIRDGYLYLCDRVKDMIISGGENIYPAEVENVLAEHPAVLEVAVIGVPDAKWGETVKACIVLRQGASASEAELIQFARERLAHYKCPTSVDCSEALPRNPSGKVLKHLLREPYWKGLSRAIN